MGKQLQKNKLLRSRNINKPAFEFAHYNQHVLLP